MQERNVDIAIIGAGTAGLGAYNAAREYTDSVVLIEGGPHGTTCARVGCMPSKLLIAAADAAHHARHTTPFGIRIEGDVQIDGRAVLERVRRERDRFVAGVLQSVEGIPAGDKLKGHARFEAPRSLRVDDHTRVTAERIVIATGSRATYPDFLRAAGDRLVINDDVFEWESLPESVAVFGPGVIGLELAQALHRLGVRLRVFGVGGALGPLSDERVRDYADSALNEEFYVDPDATIEEIERHGDSVAVTFVERDSGERLTEHFDYLLAATGRQPNVDRLGLEHAGLALNDRGIPVFGHYNLQCQNADESPSHIFIAGDANSELPLLHEASDEGRIAGENAGRFPQIRTGVRRAPLSVVFSDPQIAIVGLGYAGLESHHGGCGCMAIGEASFEDQGRARVMRVNKGVMRVYAQHGSGLFLGAEIFGPQAEHLAHLLAWSLQQGMTVTQMLAMPYYHPVIEEGVRTALRNLNASLQFGSAIRERCMEHGPGD
ncbi:dihydrolipoamide dehydrogenase [Modicisalibacter ilicicola DSM 19980]|uniref:Dihydrolipoamide dehydrogenase n=1 Tax=Modicisalibacter ilicicola DSM 19980 TaxID=1121942 RepID=A0A1M4S8H0_9GAMM|nr:dihydrolipoyl dehydrogenase [Halomonas ilicicola]SHE28490.1 dihydrolipoamide dehydrogenase [Halomonas ilicicola DSM 19980]